MFGILVSVGWEIDMEKVFLATTAMQSCWDLTARKIVLVEEGCYRNNFEFGDDAVEPECVNNQIFSHEKIDDYNIKIEKVQNKYLHKISELLNKYHNVQFCVKNWDLMMYYWMDYYIEGIYAKYKRLKTAKEQYDIYVYGLSEDHYKHPNYGGGYYIWSLRDDLYTFQLYTEIAKHMNIEIKKYISPVNFQSDVSVSKSKKTRHRGNKIRHYFNLYSKGAETIVINPNTYGFTFWDKIYVGVKSLGKTRFIYLENVQLKDCAYDRKLRENLTKELRKTAVSEFERVLAETMFYDMPICYLEGFQDLMTYGSKYAGKKTKYIITAEDWHYSEGIKNYIALLREQGAKACTIITGGQCNVSRGRTETAADIRISDVLYTTGWEESGCRFEYLTNPRFAGCKDRAENIKKDVDILYAGTAVMGYGFIMGNIMSFITIPYLKKFMFVLKALSQINDITIKVRMNHAAGDTGWNVEKLILDDLSENVIIDNWNHKFHYEARRCRLLIYDAFETIWLEVYLLGVPFIVIGIEEREYYTEDGEKLIGILEKAGIYLRDYKMAASYIENILEDVDKWWQQPERQKALKYIGENYGYFAKDPKKEWKEKFININKK